MKGTISFLVDGGDGESSGVSQRQTSGGGVTGMGQRVASSVAKGSRLGVGNGDGGSGYSGGSSMGNSYGGGGVGNGRSCTILLL